MRLELCVDARVDHANLLLMAAWFAGVDKDTNPRMNPVDWLSTRVGTLAGSGSGFDSSCRGPEQDRLWRGLLLRASSSCLLLHRCRLTAAVATIAVAAAAALSSASLAVVAVAAVAASALSAALSSASVAAVAVAASALSAALGRQGYRAPAWYFRRRP